MMGTSKWVDMTESELISRITELVAIEIEGVIKGVCMVSEMVEHLAESLAEMIMLIKTQMISMRNINLLRTTFTPTSTSFGDW